MLRSKVRLEQQPGSKHEQFKVISLGLAGMLIWGTGMCVCVGGVRAAQSWGGNKGGDSRENWLLDRSLPRKTKTDWLG